MELLLATAVGLLTATGVYLLAAPRSFDVILGLTLLSYAVNLFIVLAGRLAGSRPPVLTSDLPHTLAVHADPLPQALVLTAIVIGFAMTALLLAVAARAYEVSGSDRSTGEPREDAP